MVKLIPAATLISIVVILIGISVQSLLTKFKWFTPLPQYTDSDICYAVRGVKGAEDIAEISPRIFITSSDDRLSLWEMASKGPEVTEQGGLFKLVIGSDEADTTLSKLELNNFPNHLSFHPHGISYHAESGFLYVINHAYRAGGERIEVFFVGQKENDITVSYSHSIAPASIVQKHGMLNNLVSISKHELYASQWLPFPHLDTGKIGFWGTLRHLKFILLTSYGYKGTAIWRCTGIEPEGSPECTPLKDTIGRAFIYNGIAVSPDFSRILATDTIQSTILIFNRNLNTGELEYSETLSTNLPVDNIATDHTSSTEAYTLGSLSAKEYFLLTIASWHANSASEVSDNRTSSGASRLTRNADGSYELNLMHFFNGTALSGVSIATAFEDKIIMGSWYDDGILICRNRNVA